MPYEKDFPAITALTSDDYVRVLDGSSSKRISRDNFATQISDLIGGGGGGGSDYSLTLDATESGLVADGSVSDTEAFQAACDEAGGLTASSPTGSSILVRGSTVELPHGKDIQLANVTVPARVKVIGNGSRLRAIAGTTGDLITTGTMAQLEDLYVVGTEAATNLRGIVAGDRNHIVRVNAGLLYGSALVLGSNCRVQRCYMQGNMGADSFSDYTGVLEITQSDSQISESIFNSYRSSTAGVSASGKACGIKITDGGNIAFTAVVGELSDVAWYCDSNDGGIRLVGCRGELSRLHGYWFVDGEGELIGCDAWNNGLETTLTYDDFRFESGTRFKVDGCVPRQTGTPNVTLYGFHDTSTGGTARFRNVFGPTNADDHVSLSGHQAVKIDNADGGRVIPVSGSYNNVAAAATTLNVQGIGYAWPDTRWWLKSTSGTVSFTSITGGVPGMEISVIGDGHTSFVHSSGLAMISGADTAAVSGAVYKFHTRDGTNWFEIAGSIYLPATAISDGSITLAKLANLAQDQVIARVTASTGVPETFTCTANGRTFLGAGTFSAMRTALGLSAWATSAKVIPTGLVVGSSDQQTLTAKTVIQTLNAQTGTTYTLALVDAEGMVTLTNASAITVTIPLNSTIAFPVGTVIRLAQMGAGQVTVSPVSGSVTVNGTPGLKTRAQYSVATLYKLATNTWLLADDIAA